MPAKRDRQLMIDAARMYYVEGLDQGQTGRRLDLSRSSVSRILAGAREQGLVQVKIAGDDQAERNRELERELTRAFGLREVLVAGSMAGIPPVAQLAGQVFTKRAPTASRIGLSWGFSVGQMIDAIPTMALNNQTKLTPLAGGMPILDGHPSGLSHLQQLASKCGLAAERFDAPAIVESTETWRALMAESWVRKALQRAASSDMAFIGIETFGLHTAQLLLDTMHLDDDELHALEAARPVGGILGQFFDAAGRPVGPPTSERVVGLDIEALRRIPLVVAIAAGQDKASALLGAVRTDAIDVVVVDEALALALIAADPASGARSPGTPRH